MKKIKNFKFQENTYPQYIKDGVKQVFHNDRYYDSFKLRFICDNINRANNRNNGNPKWPNLVSPFFIYELGEKQDWKCKYSGKPLEFERATEEFQNKRANPNVLVIDRIDPKYTYSETNIQLLTHKVNTWKSDCTEKTLRKRSTEFLKSYYKAKFINFSKKLFKFTK